MTCTGCGAEIGPLLLACPTCHALVHARRLKSLAAAAANARARAEVGAELTAWREALELLPPAAEQHKRIRARIDQLSANLIDGTPISASASSSSSASTAASSAAASSSSTAAVPVSLASASPFASASPLAAPSPSTFPSLAVPPPIPTSPSTMAIGTMGAGSIVGQSSADAGAAAASTAAADQSTTKKKMWTNGALTAATLFLWKFKAIALIVLSKGKLLLLGLTNSTTLLTMLPSIGLYWTAYGWRFALGIVISIYVHEMGHVAALRRFGIAASAPMFIPGLGAVIRSRQQPTNPRELARVGLAGPIWGLGAAIAAFLMYGLTGAPIWAAIGQFGAWVNLFNLMPVWQLDGAHAFTAMRRAERWIVTAASAAMFAVTHEGMLVIIAIFAGLHAARTARSGGVSPGTAIGTAVSRANVAASEPPGDRLITAQFVGLIVVLSWMAKLLVPNAHF